MKLKRILVVFLTLLLLSFNLTAADKCNILLSRLGGYTLPTEGFIGIYFDKEGKLDINEVEKAAKYAGSFANGTREFPYWIDKEESWNKLRPFDIDGNYNIVMNSTYLENWRKIAEIYNKHNVKFWFDLFENCGLKNPWNPWTKAFGEKSFYSEKAKNARHIYIDAMLNAFRGLSIKYELVNEPRPSICTPEFLADTLTFLVKKGVEPENIILGIDYAEKEQNPEMGMLYLKFRKLVSQELGPDWDTWLKSRCISPSHNMTLENLKKMLGTDAPEGGLRRHLISMDGWKNPRPTKEQVQEVVSFILKAKPKAANQGKINFEVVWKGVNDPSDSILGVLESYKNFFGEWPENYRGYLAKPPEPESRKISITSPGEGETWKPGESHDIRWNSVEICTIPYVKIEYSTNSGTTWTVIVEKDWNDGIFKWVVPDIPEGECLLKISGIDGDASGMKGFTVAGKEPEPEKKNDKTLYYIITAAIAAALVFGFVKFPVITALVLAVLLLAAAYISYRKRWKYWYIFLIAAVILLAGLVVFSKNIMLVKILFFCFLGTTVLLSRFRIFKKS